MKKQIKTKIIKIGLQVVVYGLVILFIYSILKDNIQDLKDYQIQNIPLLLLGMLIYTLSVGLNGYIWHVIMRFSGEKMTFPQNLNVYINSYMTRYIPGNVWAIAARAVLNKEYGVRMLKSAWGWFVENMGYLLIGGFFSLFVLTSLSESNIVLTSLIPVVIIVGLVVFLNYERLGVVFDKIIKKKLSGKIGDESDILSLTIPQKLKVLGLYIISWALFSLHYFVIANSLSGIGMESILPLIGINALAYTVGYLVFIIPSGSGVREGTMVASITFLDIMSKVDAVVLTLIARITFILGEVIFLLAFKLYYFIYNKKK